MSILQEYDPRYLAGILFFNRREFFEAHEVWEFLWRDCMAEHRRFYQGLIQAAVAVYHGDKGNALGARRLFRSAHKYMSMYPIPFLGLDHAIFWREMEEGFRELLIETDAPLKVACIPMIRLSPAPPVWPDPQALLV